MVPHAGVRIAFTVSWLFALLTFLRLWELTLRVPPLMLWTLVLAAAYALTAWALHGRTLGNFSHPATRRLALWVTLVVVMGAAVTLVPQVRLSGQPVRTVVMIGLLDVVFPGWIALSAIAMLWDGVAKLAVLAGVPVVLALSAWLFIVRMPGEPYEGALPPLSPDERDLATALEAHVRALSEGIGERSDRRPEAVRLAAAYIDSTLLAMGRPAVSLPYEYEGALYRNLQVEFPGTELAEEIVIVGAHYDTAEDAPGADDNASGTAALLELARMLAADRPRRTVRLVFFVNEEPPFFNSEWMGSAVYAAEAARRGDRIVAMVSLETIGYYDATPGSQQYPPPFSFFYPDRGDFIGFVGNLSSRRLVRRAIGVFRETTRFPSHGAASPGWIPGVGWSDHMPFWRYGYKAIMITDTAPFRNPYYHTQHDTIDQLDFDRMTRVVGGVAAVVRDLATR